MIAEIQMNTALTISLFGPFQARVHGELLPPVRSRKAHWLLALMALKHGRPIEREWLSGTLWPDVDHEQALANLRTNLSELRTALGPAGGVLQSPSRSTLALDLTNAQIDSVLFDIAVRSESLAELKTAMSLYTGPLLEGCNEEWVFQERRDREALCLQALQRLAQSAASIGDIEGSTEYYRRAVRIDPWSDVLRRGLMGTLVSSGDTNEALHVYREFADVLRTEAATIPDQETTALYRRLRSEVRDAAQPGSRAVVSERAAASVNGYLPHPLTDLFGREDERADVAACLKRSRLVTLTGVGGIGKTRLALAVANDIAGSFSGGVWLVGLDTIQHGSQVAERIASVLGARPESGQPILDTLSGTIKSKRALLVLDNCEHLLSSCVDVTVHLLRECADLRILATSREALGITGETAWSVPGFAIPDVKHLPKPGAALVKVLQGYDCVQLFIDRAQAAQRSFVFHAGNAVAVADVCARLEGIPLAIELAASRVNAMTVEQVVERLTDHLSLLSAKSTGIQTRQQTIRSTMDWSYGLLSDEKQKLLRRLSVFSGGWTLGAAEAVCADEENCAGIRAEVRPLPAPAVLELLSSLVDRSLIQFEARESEPGGRYRMLEIVRQYAAERLRESGELELIRARHRNWCVALAEAAEPELSGANQRVWINRLTADYDNLHKALTEPCRDNEESRTVLRLAGALRMYWYIRAMYLEGRKILEAAIEADEAKVPTKYRARALHGAGMLCFRLSDHGRAKTLLEEALAICDRTGDLKARASALMVLGNVAYSMGDRASCQAYYERSVVDFDQVGDKRGAAIVLGNMGNHALNRGDLHESESMYRKSLALLRQVGDEFQIAWALDNLAVIASTRGDYATAQDFTDESFPIFEKLGERRGVAWALHRVGVIHQVLGRFEEAVDRLQRSAELFEELGDKVGWASSENRLGLLSIVQQDYMRARTHLDRSFRVFRDFGNSHGIAESHKALAMLARSEGDPELAYSEFVEALCMYRDLDEKKGAIDCIRGIAALMAGENRMADAARLLGAVETLTLNIGIALSPSDRKEVDRMTESAQGFLGRDEFDRAWGEGAGLSWRDAIDLALQAVD